MNKLVDEILQATQCLRAVGIIDNNKNTLSSKIAKGKVSLVTNAEEEKFAVDLQAIQKIYDEFNGKLGRTTFSHIIREKVQQLIFHVDNITVYATCESEVDHNTIVDISKQIADIIRGSR